MRYHLWLETVFSQHIDKYDIFRLNSYEKRQLNYLRNAERTDDLDFVRLRKFLLTAFGDVSAYQKVESKENTTYEEIHGRIRAKVRHIYENDLNSKAKPLIILAHSLGGHIMSNYIWDMQGSDNMEISPFERMKFLSGIVTFGCNIPFFTFAYKKVVPIEFPPAELPEKLKKKSKWINFYDPDDVLGYPLQPINKEYKNVVTKDISINAGGVLSSWNPLAHSKYWNDNDFTKPVSKFIASFL